MVQSGSLTVDLFLGSLVDAPLKDDRALMEFPFFSLEKTPRMAPIVYDDGDVKIRADPGPKGIATIWDKDLLIYLITLINDRVERGLEPSRIVRMNAYDFMRTTGRGTGKKDYALFYDTVFRLRSTTITTTIKSDDQRERTGFGWIDNFRIVEKTQLDGKQVMQGVEIALNEWMYRAVVRERRVLTISKEYWKLTSGLERRLYELARKHCGRQKSWRIGIERLAEKCGIRRDLRKFKADLKRILDRDRIPDYLFTLVNDHTHPITQQLGQLGKVGTKNQRIMVYCQPRDIADGTAEAIEEE